MAKVFHWLAFMANTLISDLFINLNYCVGYELVNRTINQADCFAILNELFYFGLISDCALLESLCCSPTSITV